MLFQQPQPLTEEAVQAVIKTLEPPSHFAATYGNGKRPASDVTELHLRFSQIRWSLAAAISAALLPIACLLLWIAVGARVHGAEGMILLLFAVGFAFTPFALWKARKQLLAEPENPRDRNLFVKAIVVYGAIVPAILVAMAAAITEGAVLMALGVVGFVYIDYLVIRRIYRNMTDGVPQPPPSTSTAAPNGNGISSVLTPAGP